MLLTKFSIFLLWIAAVFDPIGNFFYLRYLALGASIAALIWLFSSGEIRSVEKSHRSVLLLIVSILMPIYGLILYVFRGGGGEFLDTSYLASAVLMLTSLLYRSYSLCDFGVKSFVIATRLLSIVVIAGFISQTIVPGEWIGFFTERNVALVSFREYSGIPLPYIYFLASPLLILLLAYDYNYMTTKSMPIGISLFILTTLALALSGTRAHILAAIFFIPVYQLLFSNTKNLLRAASLFAIIALIAIGLEEFRSVMFAFFSTAETSNSMKLSLLDGYVEIFSNPLYFLFGQGFNAHEWSPALREMIAMEDKASKTELTYIELIRVFGIFITILLLTVIAFTVKTLKNLPTEWRWLYPGIVVFLINASLNPYLFSVNGILPLGLAVSVIYYTKTRIQRRLKSDIHPCSVRPESVQ